MIVRRRVNLERAVGVGVEHRVSGRAGAWARVRARVGFGLGFAGYVNLQPYGMSMRSFLCHLLPCTSLGLRFLRLTAPETPVTRCCRPMRQCTHRPSSRILKRLRAPLWDLSFCLRGLSGRGFLLKALRVVMDRVAIRGASGAILTSEPKAGAVHSGERWIATLMRVRVATAGRISARETSSGLANEDRPSLAGCKSRRSMDGARGSRERRAQPASSNGGNHGSFLACGIPCRARILILFMKFNNEANLRNPRDFSKSARTARPTRNDWTGTRLWRARVVWCEVEEQRNGMLRVEGLRARTGLGHVCRRK